MSGNPLWPDRTGKRRQVPARSVREFELKGKMEKRTERESDKRRRGRLLGAFETSKERSE